MRPVAKNFRKLVKANLILEFAYFVCYACLVICFRRFGHVLILPAIVGLLSCVDLLMTDSLEVQFHPQQRVNIHKNAGKISLPRGHKLPLLTLRGSKSHHRSNLREDRADASRNVRHNGPGSYRHKTRHESVFDKVLTARVFQRSEFGSNVHSTGYQPFCFQEIKRSVYLEK